MLIIETNATDVEGNECGGIFEQSEMYGVKVVSKVIEDDITLQRVLVEHGKFDYIYLSAHGSPDFVKIGNTTLRWEIFADILCSTECMNDDCFLLLSCCQSGLRTVASKMFSICGNIKNIVGPKRSLNSADMHISFGLFLYNIEVRKMDPIVACEKIKLATDLRFSCYERDEYYNDDL